MSRMSCASFVSAPASVKKASGSPSRPAAISPEEEGEFSLLLSRVEAEVSDCGFEGMSLGSSFEKYCTLIGDEVAIVAAGNGMLLQV